MVLLGGGLLHIPILKIRLDPTIVLGNGWSRRRRRGSSSQALTALTLVEVGFSLLGAGALCTGTCA
jgi:hypothetical protein